MRAEEERLRALKTMEGLQALSGVEFENVVAQLFGKLGCGVVKTAVTGDDGIDLVLYSSGVKLVVQCKRWRADIGAPVLRDFYGALMHSDAAHGFVVTTARITQSAVNFAANKPLTLIDGTLLLRWLSGKYEPRVSGHGNRRNGSGGTQERKASPDPHQVLRVSKGATREEIKAAYRREVAQYHPDKVAQLGPELQDLATEKTKQLNQAYRALTDTP